MGAAWIGAVQKGGEHFVTVYLQDTEGIGETNQAILTELAAYLGTIRGPWIVAGDWNVTPQQLKAAPWDQIVKGAIKQPNEASCNGKVYDFFVVSKSLSASVVAVTALDNGGFSPHSAVRMFLSGAARHKAVRKLTKPKAISADLPAGPLQMSPNDFDPARTLADGFNSWYAKARSSLLSLTCQQTEVQQPKFRWEPATGRLAREQPGATNASAILRTLGNRTREAARVARLHGHNTEVSRLLAANGRDVKRKELKEAGVAVATLAAWASYVEQAIAAGNQKRAAELANVVIARAKKIEKEQADERTRQWRSAMTRETPGAKESGHGKRLSRLAFRWVKGGVSGNAGGTDVQGYDNDVPDCDPGEKLVLDAAAPVMPQPDSDPTRIGPASDQATVESIASKWAELWEADATYRSPALAEADGEVLKPLTAADILLAAKSFPAATGVGADAISPRALTRLPQELLEELASLLMLAEDTGDWSTAVALVLIVLLPKDGGGYRPIGLFPTLIRVWMRARASVARDWEELTASPSQYGSKGMGAQRAAWTAAFSAETATESGNDHAAILLDLVKAFEMISHDELVTAAKKHGFSLKVLRLSLAAYRLARSIGIDEVFSSTVNATRGITAGSGFATTELRLLLVDLMFDLRKLWPVGVKLYVDDLTISAQGKPSSVVKHLTAATDHAIDKFTRLGLEVSKSKSAAVSNRVGNKRALVIKNRAKVLRGAKTTKLLGADYTSGGGRSTRVQVKRINSFASKLGRIRAIRSQGMSAVQYVQAAGIPAMMYGVDCTGIADTTLKKTVGLAAAAITPSGAA